jgi:hypothetical protein
LINGAIIRAFRAHLSAYRGVQAIPHSMLKIYNTLARDKQAFIPIEPGRVAMYVCGMTVYDYCHLGHARVMVVFDMVARWLRASGYTLNYVRKTARRSAS